MAKSKILSAEEIISKTKADIDEGSKIVLQSKEIERLNAVIVSLSAAYNDLARKLSRAGIPQKKRPITASQVKKEIAGQNRTAVKSAAKKTKKDLSQVLRAAVTKK